MKKKRSKVKKIIKGIGFGMLCCTVIYTSLTYEAIKSFVKPRKNEYNKHNTTHY